MTLGKIMVVGLGLWWAIAAGPLRDPDDVLRDFNEARDRCECQLMDPLIFCGRRVVPLLLEELPNKKMRLRRYAILFLGNGRYRSALPRLEELLADDTEIYYFRADALAAIYRISPERARELAPAHLESEDLLGRIAGNIVAGRSPIDWVITSDDE